MVATKMYELGAKANLIRTLYMFGLQQAEKVGEENVFDYSIGNPSVPPPQAVSDAIVELATKYSPMEINSYTPAMGLPKVRQGLADYMNQTYGADLKADNFYLTCGASASLAIIMKALIEQDGDEVIIIAPYYPEYKTFVTVPGGKAVIVPPDTKHFQLDMEKLAAAITPRTKAVLINSPNNPSGMVYSAETLTKLGNLLREKSQELGHPIYLISDEPYREIVYDNIPILYVPKFYKDTIILYSYSKSLSLPGNRAGYILVPEGVEDGKAVYTAVIGAGRALGFVNMPNLYQHVILKCMGMTSDFSVYDRNRKTLYNNLSEMGFDCVYPSGAFYLFMKAPDGDDMQLMENGKKINLLLVPGTGFGCPGYARISYCKQPDMIERSLPAFQKLRDMYK